MKITAKVALEKLNKLVEEKERISAIELKRQNKIKIKREEYEKLMLEIFDIAIDNALKGKNLIYFETTNTFIKTAGLKERGFAVMNGTDEIEDRYDRLSRISSNSFETTYKLLQSTYRNLLVNTKEDNLLQQILHERMLGEDKLDDVIQLIDNLASFFFFCRKYEVESEIESYIEIEFEKVSQILREYSSLYWGEATDNVYVLDWSKSVKVDHQDTFSNDPRLNLLYSSKFNFIASKKGQQLLSFFDDEIEKAINNLSRTIEFNVIESDGLFEYSILDKKSAKSMLHPADVSFLLKRSGYKVKKISSKELNFILSF